MILQLTIWLARGDLRVWLGIFQSIECWDIRIHTIFVFVFGDMIVELAPFLDLRSEGPLGGGILLTPNGWCFRNRNSPKASLRVLTIGVPVKHHLCSARRWVTAEETRVDGFYAE